MRRKFMPPCMLIMLGCICRRSTTSTEHLRLVGTCKKALVIGSCGETDVFKNHTLGLEGSTRADEGF